MRGVHTNTSPVHYTVAHLLHIHVCGIHVSVVFILLNILESLLNTQHDVMEVKAFGLRLKTCHQICMLL